LRKGRRRPWQPGGWQDRLSEPESTVRGSDTVQPRATAGLAHLLFVRKRRIGTGKRNPRCPPSLRWASRNRFGKLGLPFSSSAPRSKRESSVAGSGFASSSRAYRAMSCHSVLYLSAAPAPKNPIPNDRRTRRRVFPNRLKRIGRLHVVVAHMTPRAASSLIDRRAIETEDGSDGVGF